MREKEAASEKSEKRARERMKRGFRGVLSDIVPKGRRRAPEVRLVGMLVWKEESGIDRWSLWKMVSKIDM